MKLCLEHVAYCNRIMTPGHKVYCVNLKYWFLDPSFSFFFFFSLMKHFRGSLSARYGPKPLGCRNDLRLLREHPEVLSSFNPSGKTYLGSFIGHTSVLLNGTSQYISSISECRGWAGLQDDLFIYVY